MAFAEAAGKAREPHTLPALIDGGTELINRLSAIAARVDRVANSLGVGRPPVPTAEGGKVQAINFGLHALSDAQRAAHRAAMQIEEDLLLIENAVS